MAWILTQIINPWYLSFESVASSASTKIDMMWIEVDKGKRDGICLHCYEISVFKNMLSNAKTECFGLGK